MEVKYKKSNITKTIKDIIRYLNYCLQEVQNGNGPYAIKMCGDNRANINDNISALADLGDATESNAADSESALAELADMYASIDERITALEGKS